MATDIISRPVDEPGRPRNPVPPVSETVTPAVKWWAALGAVAVVFIAYVMISWVTGPNWEHVEPGPTPVPTFIKVAGLAFQIFSIPLALWLVYRYVIRPYRRERQIGPDGILVLGFSLMWFQDPLAGAGNHWFTYNAWMVNMGSWVNDTPGYAGWGEPGHMMVEPLLMTPAAYVYFFVLFTVLGCWLMRRVKTRWPGITTAGLVGVCFCATLLLDFVVEGLIWLPLGLYEYQGGHLAIFADTYHKWPLHEGLMIAAVTTAICSLRYFTNDRGQMFIERGTERITGSNNKRIAIRALASIGALQLIMFALYNVPGTFIGLNGTEWNEDVQKRSYLLDGICGADTDRMCPGPGVPNMKEGAAYISNTGKVVVPKGKALPKIVPFDK